MYESFLCGDWWLSENSKMYKINDAEKINFAHLDCMKVSYVVTGDWWLSENSKMYKI